MARFDPVRWVCQCKPEDCKGTFFVRGRGTPCPLWPRCAGHKPQLEYLYDQASPRQIRIHVFDPNHGPAHAKRLKDLTRAFCPEKVQEQRRRQYERARDRESAIQARKYREDHLPGAEEPKVQVPPPPCGGDCENCPHGNECRYPTWEEDWLTEQGLALKTSQNAAHAARHKVRMATDPEYAQRYRARKNAAAQARRDAETPEERENRRAGARAYYQQRCVNVPAEDREALRAARSAQYHAKKAAMTPEEREVEKAKNREKNARWRARETPEHREARLARVRAKRKAKRETETSEEREARNAKQRENYAKCRAAETSEQREARRAYGRAYYHKTKEEKANDGT